MPYFKWRGVTIAGNSCSGKKIAQSPEALMNLLAQKKIALIECQPARYFSPFKRVNLAQKINFFEQLATLVDASILVPQALAIISTMLEAPYLQEIIYQLCNDIEHGNTFSNALAKHPKTFSPLAIQLIKAGEEAGNLPAALRGICTHLRLKQDFKQKVQSALAVPLITIIFMSVVATIILLIILPRFATFFAQMHKDLPPFTQKLLALSAFAQSRSFLYVIGGMVATMIGCYWLFLQQALKPLKGWLTISLPFVGQCMRYQFLAHFFQSFSLLLSGGSKVVPALETIVVTIDNEYLRKAIAQLITQVSAGHSLSNAMNDLDWLFDHDMVAMVHVGEESGRLAAMLAPVANQCQARLYQKLTRATLLIQPTLMIALGLCVTALIIAIYGPLCSLADITTP